MRFADPWFLLLLTVPLAYGWRLWSRRRRPPADHIGFPALGFLDDAPATRPARWRWLPDALRVGGLSLLILALARPQQPTAPKLPPAPASEDCSTTSGVVDVDTDRYG